MLLGSNKILFFGKKGYVEISPKIDYLFFFLKKKFCNLQLRVVMQNITSLILWSFFQGNLSFFKNIIGIYSGFTSKIKVYGVGFKVMLTKIFKTRVLILRVGYNHNLNIIIPHQIDIAIFRTFIVLKSNCFETIHYFRGILCTIKNIAPAKF